MHQTAPSSGFGVNILNKPYFNGGKRKGKNKKKKSVMDGNIFVTISFVHQNQGEVIFHIAISVNGSPTEVHRTQGQMKEIQTQRVP